MLLCTSLKEATETCPPPFLVEQSADESRSQAHRIYVTARYVIFTFLFKRWPHSHNTEAVRAYLTSTCQKKPKNQNKTNKCQEDGFPHTARILFDNRALLCTCQTNVLTKVRVTTLSGRLLKPSPFPQ